MTQRQFEEVLQQMAESTWTEELKKTREKAFETYGNMDRDVYDVTMSDELYVNNISSGLYVYTTPNTLVSDLYASLKKNNYALLPFINDISVEAMTRVHWVNKTSGDEGYPTVACFNRKEYKPSTPVVSPETLLKPIPAGTVIEVREFSSGDRDKAELKLIDLSVDSRPHYELPRATGKIGDVIVFGELPYQKGLLVRCKPLTFNYELELSSCGDVVTDSKTIFVELLWK